jgi:hypothetical protein
MEKKGNKLTIVLICVIVILLGVLVYGFYTGIKVKAELERLNGEINNLNTHIESLEGEKNSLIDEKNRLMADVAEIYKTCRDGACKGRYPGISWYCNNVGDEATTNYSHTCKCDASCNLIAVQVNN